MEAVGADTFANRILAQAKGHRDLQTPLQADIARAFVAVGVLIALSALIVALAILSQAEDAPHDTVFAAAVLITLVPQGLALMLTVTYAAAAVRISRLGALAQRQSAIESMSRIDTFCSDKTGTLTTQRIRFAALEPIAADTDPAAVERDPGGGRRQHVRAERHHGRSRARPSRVAAVGVREEVAFSSALRWSAIRFETGDPSHSRPAGPRSSWVLRPCSRRRWTGVVTPSTNGRGPSLRPASGSWPSRAAHRRPPSRRPTKRRIPGPLEPLALLTFIEELRPEAQATIDGLRARGIDVKIVSGDDPNTVEAIGRTAGARRRWRDAASGSISSTSTTTPLASWPNARRSSAAWTRTSRRVSSGRSRGADGTSR